jgi:hypothetical protein
MIDFLHSAIIVQGKYIENYTNNVLINYLNNTAYTIILATWENSVTGSEIELIRIREKFHDRFHFILLAQPEYCGYQNVNLQIISSYNGIKIAENLGIKYAAKVRSDFYFECDILKIYFEKVLDKSRVLAFESTNPMKNLFFVSDFIFVGPINELKNIFTCSLIQSGNNRVVKDEFNRRIHDSDYFSLENNSNAERYLLVNYLKNSGYVVPHNFLEMSYTWINFLLSKFYLVKVSDLKFSSLNKYDSLNRDNYVYPYLVKYQKKGGIFKKIILFIVYFNLLFIWVKNHIGNLVFFIFK